VKVAILGCGATGSVIARLLSRENFVSDGICLDKNVNRAKKFLGEEGFKVEKVDARNIKDLRKKLKDCDWVINSLPTAYYTLGKEIIWSQKIMKVALDIGINYYDLACFGGKSTIAEQLHFQKKFEKEKIVGIINAGASPGLTNLLAKDNADELDYVEKITIRTLEEQEGREFILPWSKEGMLDMVSYVLVYTNRRFKFKEPFSEVSTYDFPPPFKKMYCYLVSNDEVYTIPHFISTRYLDVKNAGSDIETLRTLYRLGIFEDTPIYFRKMRILPKDFIYSIIPDVPTSKEMIKIVKRGILEDGFFGIFVENLGRVVGKKVVVKSYTIFPSQKAINDILPGANYITYPTGVCAVYFLKTIYKRKMYGVFPPETFSKSIRERIIDELEKREIIISNEYKSLD
jgi:saccharopine dehydrogenase-like NADP-dependent oxidoreductase